MTFMQIIVLVLVAVLILTILFALFHIFIALLPVGIVAALIIWVMYLFTKKKIRIICLVVETFQILLNKKMNQKDPLSERKLAMSKQKMLINNMRHKNGRSC